MKNLLIVACVALLFAIPKSGLAHEGPAQKTAAAAEAHANGAGACARAGRGLLGIRSRVQARIERRQARRSRRGYVYYGW